MRPKSFIFLSHIGTNGTTFQNGSGEYLSKCLPSNLSRSPYRSNQRQELHGGISSTLC
ncbi:hypothetical protein DPMN_087162 [Dreissena polymorpha]|uniref:Uncharacterized protein n=1 Tax=Dreissena polymorpha TaxID=45954 RepID=A0A9D4KS64_DREPO|nr:hypothetical protein DPMN_087162 [Dreissena polymorpha]